MSQKRTKTVLSEEAGFMGLDGMGSLLFYLVMLAGAALLVVQLFSSSKLAKTEQAVSTMRIAIKHLYFWQRNYGTGTTEAERDMTNIIVDAGLAPKGFKLGTNADGDFIMSPWNTPMTVRTERGGKAFSIAVRTPPEYCLRLATYDLVSWYRVTVGDYKVIDDSTAMDPDSVKNALEGLDNSRKDNLITVRFFSE